MIRVLFVSHTSELNGAELWLLETLQGLDRSKIEPLLIVPGPGRLEDAARAAGIDTVRSPLVWWISDRSRLWRQPAAWAVNRRCAARLFRLVRDGRIDLVFSNSAAVSAGAIAASRAGLPHVWAVHEMLGGPAAHLFHLRGARRLTRFILDRSSRVIVNSRFCASAFPASEKIVLVHNGFEPKPADVSRQTALRREFGVGPGDPVLGIVGKLYAGKGQREAILAASRLIPDFPRLKLLVAGEVRDADYAASLSRIAAETGLGDRVVFTGYRPDLADWLRVLSVLVVASTVESFGRAALDAMAAGTPVVAVKAGGLPEIVRDGENGVLVTAGDPEALADGIRRVLADPALARRLAENGRRTVATEFRLDEQVRRVAAIITECAGGRSV